MAEGKFLIDAEAITMRMPSAVLQVLDAWRRKQTDSLGRAEAIRRMVEQALTSTDSRPIAAEAHHKTAKMASREIDKLGANCELDAAAWSLHLVDSAVSCQPTDALRKEREMQVEIEYCGM
jgi:hypothetical protein